MKGLAALISVAVILAMGACRRSPAKVATATPPPAVDYFQEGERNFRSGNYAEAVKAYDAHLRNQTTAENQDLALLRIALVYAVAPDPLRDPARSAATLHRLVSGFPQSSWRPHAEFMLELQGKVNKLQSEVAEKDDHIRRLRTEAKDAHKLDEELRKARTTEEQEQMERMKAEVKERENRIRSLSTEISEMQERLQRLDKELEALKRIDRQRRPSRPTPQ
jgi:outer membrane protein assembly factor BamD (BamD/ComL family)